MGGGAGQRHRARDAAHQPERQQRPQQQRQPSKRPQRQACPAAQLRHAPSGVVDGLALRLAQRVQRLQQRLRCGQKALGIHLLDARRQAGVACGHQFSARLQKTACLAAHLAQPLAIALGAQLLA